VFRLGCPVVTDRRAPDDGRGSRRPGSQLCARFLIGPLSSFRPRCRVFARRRFSPSLVGLGLSTAVKARNDRSCVCRFRPSGFGGISLLAPPWSLAVASSTAVTRRRPRSQKLAGQGPSSVSRFPLEWIYERIRLVQSLRQPRSRTQDSGSRENASLRISQAGSRKISQTEQPA